LRVTIKKNPEGFSRVRTQAQALAITSGDFAGPVLVVFGQLHRKQEKAILVSEGAAGASGRWPALSPPYEKKKRKLFARRKMLHLSGAMRSSLLTPTNPNYIQRFVPRGTSGGVFQFGAASDVAAAHLKGNPALAPNLSAAGKRIFGGLARRLPVRDMINKTAAMLAEFNRELVKWYALRVQQVLRRRK
jgi:hypothetical protein